MTQVEDLYRWVLHDASEHKVTDPGITCQFELSELGATLAERFQRGDDSAVRQIQVLEVRECAAAKVLAKFHVEGSREVNLKPCQIRAVSLEFKDCSITDLCKFLCKVSDYG
jgi:hypothetical protein